MSETQTETANPDEYNGWDEEYVWCPWWSGKWNGRVFHKLRRDWKKHVNLGGMGETSFHMTQQESYYPKASMSLHIIKEAAKQIRNTQQEAETK